MGSGRAVTKACASCHQKKIKCVPNESHDSCTACLTADVQCMSRSRKKRRLTGNQPAQIATSDNDPAFRPRLAPRYDITWHSSGGNMTEVSEMAQQMPFLTERSPSLTNPSPLPNENAIIGPANRGQITSVQHSMPDSLSSETTSAQSELVSPPSQSWNSSNATTYMGRAHYVREDEHIDETDARSYPPSKATRMSEQDAQGLKLWNAFDLPSRSARQSLLDFYMRYCYPWTPILGPEDQYQALKEAPQAIFLVQSVFVAATRVSSSPMVSGYASTEQMYARAKALFWLGHEKDPLTVIKGTLALHWYNPDGPEHFSLDSSEFWLKIGVGLAQQIGLHREPPPGPSRIIRRRLWWSLVARDCLIAVSHGRPRAINLDDCQVRPPEQLDFPNDTQNYELFMHYIEICRLLGDITDCCARDHLSSTRRLDYEGALFRWLRTLPKSLQLSSHNEQSFGGYYPSTENLNARQLHLPYFIALAILSRFTTPKGHISPQAVIASSFAAGIFETFLARDEVKILAPTFSMYCLIAAMVLVSVHSHPTLREAAQPDISVFKDSLHELSKRWRSAIGASKALQHALNKVAKRTRQTKPLQAGQFHQADIQRYFEGCPTEICRMWTPLEQAATTSSAPDLGFDSTTLGNYNLTATIDLTTQQYEDSIFDDPTMSFYQYDQLGNWLLNDPDLAAM